MLAAFSEKGRTVNAVERVFKVNLEKDLVLIVSIAAQPVPTGVDPNFGAKWLGNANLQGKEKRGGVFLRIFAEALGNQTAPHLTHGDRANIIVLFWQCC
jgi:hypothetical protein